MVHTKLICTKQKFFINSIKISKVYEVVKSAVSKKRLRSPGQNLKPKPVVLNFFSRGS